MLRQNQTPQTKCWWEADDVGTVCNHKTWESPCHWVDNEPLCTQVLQGQTWDNLCDRWRLAQTGPSTEQWCQTQLQIYSMVAKKEKKQGSSIVQSKPRGYQRTKKCLQMSNKIMDQNSSTTTWKRDKVKEKRPARVSPAQGGSTICWYHTLLNTEVLHLNLF